jgi:hypothetical protein
MVSTRDEINAAINALTLPLQVCRALPDPEARQVFQAALNKFVGGDDRRWWWEAFTKESVSRQIPDGGWRLLCKLVPDESAHVWFIAEDRDLPFYPVYEATPRAIEKIIGECFGFEYYLVAKDFSWLLL